MAKSSKIVVSKRTEAQFRKLYGYRNKSLQAYINAILKDREALAALNVAATPAVEDDILMKHEAA